MDIILTEAGGPVGFHILESLASHGLSVWISDVSADGPAFSCGLAAGCFTTPHPQYDETGFIRTLKSKATELGSCMLLPVFHPEIIARHREEFPEGTLIPLDSLEKLLFLDNKCATSELAGKLGIRQPKTYTNPSEVKSYPIVFKRSEGLGGAGVYFPGNPGALEKLVAKAGRLSYLITDFIEGDDYSIDCIRWDGYFAAGAYKVLMPKRKGFSFSRVSVAEPELEAAARRILEEVDYKGLCGMDFRRDKQGRFWFLECNPRFSGGIHSQTASGFDLPYLFWCLVTGASVPGYRFRAGVRTMSLSGARTYIARRRAKRRLTFGEFLRCIPLPGTKVGK